MAADVRLKFHSLLPLVLEVADDCWRHLDGEEAVTRDDQTDESDARTVLRHGKTWKHIHGYFSNLEFRRCCLCLRGKPTQHNKIKLVDQEEEEVMGRMHKTAPTVDKLNDKEFAVYGQALLCAQFPRLCVSTPAGSTSPEHYSYASELRTQYSASATESISLTSDPEDATASVIPTETLCEILRLAFGISRELAAQYERMVYEQYKRKSREKILVEELMCQLSFLENNKHPFYNSSTFLNKGAYEQWQQLQRQHIMALINKVWHFTLPPLKGSIHYDPAQFHENYKILMEKMVRFENSNRPDEPGTGAVISSPLSTAALRLLKEYGLRYGVGEQYRRLVYLEYLAEHFENEVWYIQHLHSVLEGLLDGLPATCNRAVMVQAEHDIFVHTCDILYGQCENSLTRIKRLFTSPKVNAAQGVACLLELLALTLRLKRFLQDKSMQPIDVLLNKYTKKCLEITYERHKLIAVTDMELSDLEDHVTPKLIGRIIIAIRDEVKDYRDVFSVVYDRYLDVAQLAAQVFYEKLLEDVKALFTSITPLQQNKEEEILPLLALVYKLNQLDTEWSAYIALGDQIWREWVIPESMLWMDLLRNHSRQFIMQAVCADEFEPVSLKSKHKKPKDNGRTQSTTSTTTAKSITQSEHSAFTPIKPTPRAPPDVSVSTCQTKEATSPRDLPFNFKLNAPNKQSDQFQVLSDRRRFEPQRNSGKSGLYIAKSLSSPELVSLKNYAQSIDKLQSDMESVQRRSFSDISELRDKVQRSGCLPEDQQLTKSSSVLRSLPGSLGSDHHINLMESGNFTFMQKSTEPKHQMLNYTAEFGNTTMKNVGVSSQPTKPTDQGWTQMQPHSSVQRDRNIEILAVTHIESSHEVGHNVDRDTVSSDSETEYEEVDSNYTDSSAEEEKECDENGNERQAFPPLTAIETSWNGSLGSLCIDAYVEPEVTDAHTIESKRDHREQAVVHLIGTNGHEKERNSPSNAFHRITKLTSQMLDAHLRRSERLQRIKAGGKRVPTPISSARSTPTVHWNPVTTTGASSEDRKLLVSGSLVDVSCLIHRMINFVGTLCQTLHPLPSTQVLSSATDRDRNVVQILLHARQEILHKLLQTIWLIVTGYANNLLAFDICGEVEKRAKLLVDCDLVDEVKNEFKAGYIWGCRHQQKALNCNEYINKKAAYLADRFEPISEKMCIRLNNVWSLLGTLNKFQREAHDAVDLDYLTLIMNRLEPSANDPVIDGYDIVDYCEFVEDSELGESNDALNAKVEGKKNVVFEQSTQHLNKITEGLANLLAYRMNLFFTEALHLLLSIDIPGVSLKRRLVPATEFLRNHLMTLDETLYQPCFKLTVQKLWTLVVKDFEAELDDLALVNGYTFAAAKELLEVIAHYLKFFKDQAQSVDVDALAQQTEDVCERLQLHTLSTKRLLQVHKRLQQASQLSANGFNSEEGLPSKECIEVMRKHLHAQRKTFNGSVLVRFIKTNRHMFDVTENNRGFYDEDSFASDAEKIAQKLLDAGIIVCNEEPVQASHPSDSFDTSVGSTSPYPAMGIYSTSCSASTPRGDMFAQIYRKTSAAMTEQDVPVEDEEPLTFGNHVKVTSAVSSARKIIDRRKASKQRNEQNFPASQSLPDIVNEASVLLFNTSNSNGVLSQSLDGGILQDEEDAPETFRGEHNGEFTYTNGIDALDVSGTTTRATTASPSVVSNASYSTAGLFQNATNQFYRFSGQFDELLLDLDSDNRNNAFDPTQSVELNHSVQLNGSWYTDKKITAEFILSILNTRKGVDPQARHYLQSLPEHMLCAANIIAQHQSVTGCFGFISQ